MCQTDFEQPNFNFFIGIESREQQNDGCHYFIRISGRSHGMKIVCPVFIESDLSPGGMPFAFDKVDWNLCTHIIGMNRAGKGKRIVEFGGKNELKFDNQLKQANS